MSTNLYPSTITYPKTLVAPAVYLRETWSDSWVQSTELEFIAAKSCSSGQDLGVCEVARRYGQVMAPGEDVYSVRTPLALNGYWLRVDMYDGAQWVTQWVGRIESESRQTFGAPVVDEVAIPTGIQRWRAYEPSQYLRKIHVSGSYWLGYDGESNEELRQVEWVPDVNSRDRHNTLVGNRTAEKWETETYLFGGTDLWTRQDYLEYILFRFASVTDGPAFVLDGAYAVLADVSDAIDMRDTQTVDSVLKKLISPKIGLDYKISYDGVNDQFSVYVYSLAATATTFETATLPANTNDVYFDRGSALDVVGVNLVESDDHNYSTIRILGKRAVVCLSLRGFTDDGHGATLYKGWTNDEETDYLAGTGLESEPEEHDEARQRDEMSDVFQTYIAPEEFDPDTVYARPTINGDGTVSTDTSSDKWQNSVRRTLNWVPLYQGIDYTQGAPATIPTDAELMRPMAWIKDEETARYVPIDTVGMSLSVLAQQWGIHVGASPNHLLALGYFDGAAATKTEPKYDYTTLCCTVAIESDQRLKLEQALVGGDGSVMEVVDETAELWYLAKRAILGCTQDAGELYLSESGVVLRNDITRLNMLMAGAISRYQVSRYRAEIALKGLLPWSSMVGGMLTVTDAETDYLAGPITEVQWNANGETLVRAGFAGA